MTELKYVKTTTYEVGLNFCIDIVEDGLRYDAWIYNTRYGIKEHMMGTSSDTKELVDESLKDKEIILEYMIIYARHHMDMNTMNWELLTEEEK